MSQSSAEKLQDLKRRRLDLRKEGNALIDFLCEDKDTFKLDECFRIFQDFCIKFKKAVKVGFSEWIFGLIQLFIVFGPMGNNNIVLT